MRAAGSGLGAAGFIVHDDTACMVEVARQISRFLFVESSGQCPPCKLGGEQITERLTRIQNGVGPPELLEWRRFAVAGVEDDGRLDWRKLGEES
jgi:NADH-quinone oxidoreductase subunit F